MKLAAFLFLISVAYGQPTQLSLSAGPPTPVTSGSGGPVGATGQTPLYYWVIARYGAGASVPLGPIIINNTVGAANLTTSNYVTLGWTGMGGATGYDVLRSTSPAYPASPSCASCAVAVNTTSTTVNDQAPTGSAYPNGAPGAAPGAVTTWSINNRDLDIPWIQVSTNYGGQTNIGAWIQFVLTAPSGSCTNGAFPLRHTINTTDLWACASGTWQEISGGGGTSVDCGSTGILVQTAPATFVCRTITAGTGISVSNGNGVSGNPTITSTAAPDCGTNGYKVRSALNTTVCRTFTTVAGLVLANADGTAGNTQYSIDFGYVPCLGCPNTFSGNNLFTAELGAPNSGTLPATCAVGDVYFKTGVTAGQNWYGCTTANTWTLQGAPGGQTLSTTDQGWAPWGLPNGVTAITLAALTPIYIGVPNPFTSLTLNSIITSMSATSGNVRVAIFDRNCNRVAQSPSTAEAASYVGTVNTLSATATVTDSYFYVGLVNDTADHFFSSYASQAAGAYLSTGSTLQLFTGAALANLAAGFPSTCGTRTALGFAASVPAFYLKP